VSDATSYCPSAGFCFLWSETGLILQVKVLCSKMYFSWSIVNVSIYFPPLVFQPLVLKQFFWPPRELYKKIDWCVPCVVWMKCSISSAIQRLKHFLPEDTPTPHPYRQELFYESLSGRWMTWTWFCETTGLLITGGGSSFSWICWCKRLHQQALHC